MNIQYKAILLQNTLQIWKKKLNYIDIFMIV